MIIDGRTHVWQRKMPPDSLQRAYMEPLRAPDGLLDMKQDREQDFPMSQVDMELLIQSMKEAGVDKAVILPLDFGLVAKTEVSVEAYNDRVFQNCGSFDDRLVPFIGIDPNRGTRAVGLVEKYVRNCSAKGVKVYSATGFYPNEERMHEFWDLMVEYDLVVLTHAGASRGPLDENYSHPILFGEVLERLPGLKLVIEHLGGKFRSETYELARQFSNVYTDCSALQGWLPSEPDCAGQGCGRRSKTCLEE